MFYFYIWGFAPNPTSFATEGSTCSIATKKQLQPAFGERLYFSLNLIFYLICQTKLVLFSTNFILALSRSVSEFIEDIRFFDSVSGKKNNKKIDKLYNF